MRRYVTILFVGLAGYLAYPTAPPWLASKDGLLGRSPGSPAEAGPSSESTGRTWSCTAWATRSPRCPRCTPASPRLVAFWAVSRLRSPWRWLLLLYPVAMGVALCYFGEHYVVDEIAGVLVAGLVMARLAAYDRRARA